MKAWQRQIREREAKNNPRSSVMDLSGAVVREISYDEAKTIIVKYEWLGNMGSTEHAFGLFLNDELAGAVCFGQTAGTNTTASICGTKYADKVVVLVRGACVHWAPRNAASFLISNACQMMATMMGGCCIVVAYADPDAGEIGTVYQASNWLYCGQKSGSREHWVWPHEPEPWFDGEPPRDGKVRDSRCIHSYTRDRRGVERNTYYQKITRKQMKAWMLKEGFIFLNQAAPGSDEHDALLNWAERQKDANLRGLQKSMVERIAKNIKANPKHRYVGIYADARTKRLLRRAQRWQTLPYPKRNAAEVTGGNIPTPSERARFESARSLQNVPAAQKCTDNR